MGRACPRASNAAGDTMAWDPRFVIPAQAGIQVGRVVIVLLRLAAGNLDSRLRALLSGIIFLT